MKPAKIAIAAIIGVPVLWSAGWFAGKSLYVEPEADKAVERLRDGEVFFAYDRRNIGGFPFAYDVSYEGVSISNVTRTLTWTANSLRVHTSIANTGEISLIPSTDSKLAIRTDGAEGSAPVIFDINAKTPLISLRQNNDILALAIRADTFTAAQYSGDGLIAKTRLNIEALAFDSQVTEGGEKANGVFSAGIMDAAYSFSPDMIQVISSDSKTRNAKVSFSATGLKAETITEFLNNGSFDLAVQSDGGEGSGSDSGGLNRPPLDMKYDIGTNRVTARLADGHVFYDAEAKNVDYVMTNEALPPDSKAKLSSLDMDFDMPVRVTPEAGDYNIRFNFAGLSVDEALWSMFDPAQAIPRSELNLDMDLGGKVRVLMPLGDIGPETTQAPVDVETLEVRKIHIDGLGAEADASGSLDIAGDASTPIGVIQLSLRGAMGLLNNLASSGLLPPQQAGGIAIMAQQFLRPGDGADHFLAEIEMTDTGPVINGRRF